MDDATEDFGRRNVTKGIEAIAKAFDLLKKYLEGANDDKYKRVKKFIVYCSTYRFAFQLLIGIQQMKEQKNHKKEIFLYLVLIQLNLKPMHRMNLIILSNHPSHPL